MTNQTIGTPVNQTSGAAARLTAALTALIAVSAMVFLVADAITEEFDDDQIAASFQREFERTPAPAEPVTRSAIDEDVLYEEINSLTWTVDVDRVQIHASDDSTKDITTDVPEPPFVPVSESAQ